MPQRNLINERELGEKCKIRKRGGSSSSSSSSLVQNFRLKRAILVRKRGGSSTPVPTWKMSTRLSPLHGDHTGKLKEASMSARKLAATLWEIDEAPSHNFKQNLNKGREETTVRHSTHLSQIPVSEVCIIYFYFYLVHYNELCL